METVPKIQKRPVHAADRKCKKQKRKGIKYMEIRILTVGKIKEKYLSDGIAEYALNIQIKDTEGDRLMKYIRDQDYVIALAIDGKMLDSVELSEKIEKLGVSGISSVAFVIGGSLGLSEKVLQRADYKLSFSKMTFPHQLMQMILLEQIYRSYRIMNHEPYHK